MVNILKGFFHFIDENWKKHSYIKSESKSSSCVALSPVECARCGFLFIGIWHVADNGEDPYVKLCRECWKEVKQ